MVDFRSAMIVSTLVLVGCASAPEPTPDDAQPVDTSSRFGFMGLDDAPLQADWENWTPTTNAAAPSLKPFLAFDAWTLTNVSEAEQLWASSFSMLDAARGYLPEDAAPTVRELMTLLDPGSNPGVVTTDVVFIVGEEREQEGVLFRTYREMPNGGSPGLVLEMRRSAGSSNLPETVVLHLHSGYEEAPSYRVDFGAAEVLRWAGANPADAWNVIRADGLARELAVTRDIVEASFWRPTIGTAYVEPIWTIARGESGIASAQPGFPAGHGTSIDLRPIDAVLTDTVFPPRLDLGSRSN